MRRFPRRPALSSPRRRYFRPRLEPCEERQLLSGLFHAAAAGHTQTSVPAERARANPLAPYRVFEGTITRGPAAGLTLDGPLVLGYDGRIQVIGYLFESAGERITVVGTLQAGAVNLRFVIPTRTGNESVEASGSGQLRKVHGGLPDGLSLVGSGNLNGPDFRRDFGTWKTVTPSHAALAGL